MKRRGQVNAFRIIRTVVITQEHEEGGKVGLAAKRLSGILRQSYSLSDLPSCSFMPFLDSIDPEQ